MSHPLPKSLIESWKLALLRKGQGSTDTRSLEPILHRNVQNLGSELKKIWTTYTSERQDLRRGLLGSPKATSAYLAGFHLANCARSWNVLKRCQPWLKPDEFKKVQIVDLGCGTGAMSASLQAYFSNAETRITLVDNTASLLDKARDILSSTSSQTTIRGHKSGIESVPLKVFEGDEDELLVVSFGYVLNELATNPRAQRHLGKILEVAKKRNCLIMALEPANQNPSRKLMEFRNQLVEMEWNISYPCPTQAPCPMLERRRDWCYSEFAWDRPGLQKKIDRLMGIERNKIATCGFVFSSKATPRPERQVVVGKPLGHKTKRMELLLCQHLIELCTAIPHADRWYARGLGPEATKKDK